MKLRLVLTALLLSVTFATAPALVHAGGVKVEVCHIPPDDPENFHTINVSEKALDSHIAHGDLLGSCDIPAEERCDDGLYCTIDAFIPGTVTCDNSQQKCLDDDNDACTTEQFCDEVNDVCGTVPLDVDDGNKCTVDTCDSVIGAVNAPIDCGEGMHCIDPEVGCEPEVPNAVCPCFTETFPDWLASTNPLSSQCSSTQLFEQRRGGSDNGIVTVVLETPSPFNNHEGNWCLYSRWSDGVNVVNTPIDNITKEQALACAQVTTLAEVADTCIDLIE